MGREIWAGAPYVSQTQIEREKRFKQFNRTNGGPKYKCYNPDIDAAVTDIDWEIFKFSEDFSEKEGPRVGAINTETVINALSWNI